MFRQISAGIPWLLAVLLVGCGGGGDSGSSSSQNPLSAYSGTYVSGCVDGRDITTLVFRVNSAGVLEMSLKEETYSQLNCGGSIVSTYSLSIPATFTSQGSAVVSVAGIGSTVQNLSIDRALVSVPAQTATFTGPGVQGRCVVYAGGSSCYDSLTISNTTVDGGLFLSGRLLYILEKIGNAYSVQEGPFTKQ